MAAVTGQGKPEAMAGAAGPRQEQLNRGHTAKVTNRGRAAMITDRAVGTAVEGCIRDRVAVGAVAGGRMATPAGASGR
jgi:hypothetical protein